MTPAPRTMSYLASLLAVAVIVLQFAAVQHSIEHGGTLPDIGCEFCVSGASHASLSTHSAALHPAPPSAEAPLHAHPVLLPDQRRVRPPTRGPPHLA